MHRTEVLWWIISSIHIHLCICTTYSGYKLYRLDAEEAESAIIRQLEGRMGLDIWRQNNESMDVMVAPAQQSKFRSVMSTMNIRPQTLLKDVQRVLDQHKTAFRSRGVPGELSFDRYSSYDEMLQYMDNLQKSYGHIVQVSTFGRTYEGRDMRVVRITRCKASCPVIVVDGGIHAREWISPAMALYVINQLVTNTTECELVNHLDWRIIPVLNPDGYEFSRTTDQLWRKSRSKQANNCIGVDMNRNFDIHWSEVGTNSDPCSAIYPGTHPFSEAETRALWQYVERLKGLAKLYLSFHSYGNMILLPWSYTKSPPYDIHKLKMVAQKAGDSMPEKQYRIGSPADVLYAVGGSSTDFVKHYAGVGLTFAVEITKTKWGFFLPPEYIQSEVEALYKAVKAFAKALL